MFPTSNGLTYGSYSAVATALLRMRSSALSLAGCEGQLVGGVLLRPRSCEVPGVDIPNDPSGELRGEVVVGEVRRIRTRR
jgi:hypothetical protein